MLIVGMILAVAVALAAELGAIANKRVCHKSVTHPFFVFFCIF